MAKSGRSAAPSPGLQFVQRVGTPGFVRVARNEQGTWWLLDADDRPFFLRGVAAVNRLGRAGGRGLNRQQREDNLTNGSGETGGTNFRQTVLERMRRWQCNGLGAWADPELHDAGVHFVETVGFRQAAPEATIKLGGALLPDVFDPRWIEACDVVARQVCQPICDNRELVGYLTDENLVWAQPPAPDSSTVTPERPSLLQICLSLEPSFPGYHAAWEFVLAPHFGDLAALAAAWEIEPNKEALRQLTLADTPLKSVGYLSDQERFTREFARRYFSTCAAAIRRVDPHHLLLGCLHDGSPGPAVLAECASPVVDVVAIRCDRVELAEFIDAYGRATSLPVLLAEFSWVGEAFQTAKLDARRLTTVERMLANGRAAITRACGHPAMVGYVWSRWSDGPDDEPPFGAGLVHVDGRDAREHTELLTELNARAESLHRASSSPSPVASAAPPSTVTKLTPPRRR